MKHIIKNSTDTENPIPIREISRLTGVNSVTLRAWERRYGLIKPLRTDKGHRLYRRDDIELIKKIQAWLARGLAIGKVSELLESGYKFNDLVVDNSWQTYCDDLLELLAELNVTKLDAFFHQLFSVYPAAIITDQLINPVLHQLSQNLYGNGIKKAIIESRLSEYLMMLTQRQRQQASCKSIAILQINAVANPLLNVLLHYGLVMRHIKSELIGLVAVDEMVFAVDQLALDGLIIYNDSCSGLGEFQKELIQLSQKISLPIIVAGKLASVIDTQLPSHVHLSPAEGQQIIEQMVDKIFPLNSLAEHEERL